MSPLSGEQLDLFSGGGSAQPGERQGLFRGELTMEEFRVKMLAIQAEVDGIPARSTLIRESQSTGGLT